MKRILLPALSLVFLGLATLPHAVLAQNPDKEIHRTVVEIKDGKVFLNGKEIAEIEDADAPVVFQRSGEDMISRLWRMDDGPDGRPNGFVFRSDDGPGFRLRSMPHAYGFTSDDGKEMEFFSDRDFEDVFEVRELARRETAEAMAEIKRAMPALSLFAERNVISEKTLMTEQQTRELAQSIRREDGDTAALEAELDQLLAEAFQEKQAAQQQRVEQMRKQLTELEERLQQRQNDREQIISKRKEQLLGRESRFDW